MHALYSNTPLKIRVCNEHVLVDAKLTVMSRFVFTFFLNIFERYFKDDCGLKCLLNYYIIYLLKDNVVCYVI